MPRPSALKRVGAVPADVGRAGDQAAALAHLDAVEPHAGALESQRRLDLGERLVVGHAAGDRHAAEPERPLVRRRRRGSRRTACRRRRSPAGRTLRGGRRPARDRRCGCGRRSPRRRRRAGSRARTARSRRCATGPSGSTARLTFAYEFSTTKSPSTSPQVTSHARISCADVRRPSMRGRRNAPSMTPVELADAVDRQWPSSTRRTRS